MSTSITGVVAQAEFQSKNDKNWKRFNITLQDGRVLTAVSVPPDGPDSFSPGTNITFVQGKFTKDLHAWVYSKPKAEEGSPNPPSGGNSGNSSRDWDGFNKYQIDVRDPQIRKQTYIRFAVDMYIAALPHLDQAPSNTDEIDRYLDDAIAKGVAMDKANL